MWNYKLNEIYRNEKRGIGSNSIFDIKSDTEW